MGKQTNDKICQEPEIQSQVPPQGETEGPHFGPDFNCRNMTGAETSTTSAIARSLEAQADVRVTC